jgi:hypothetical protein
MFTVLKVRADLAANDYRDPGPYKNPQGTVAYEFKGTPAEPTRRSPLAHAELLGPSEEAITAFTHYGVDSLTELVKMVKADPDLLRRYTPGPVRRRTCLPL